jgi:hypothetical protein
MAGTHMAHGTFRRSSASDTHALHHFCAAEIGGGDGPIVRTAEPRSACMMQTFLLAIYIYAYVCCNCNSLAGFQLMPAVFSATFTHFFYLFFVRFMYDPRSHVQQNGGRGEKMDQSL